MKKKIVALTLIVVLALTATIGGTLAYFTDDDAAKNVFTVGNLKIDLTEPAWTDGSEEHKDVYPGEALPKDPMVENKGKNPCFVRIKLNDEEFDQLGGDMITFEYENGQAWSISPDWTKGADGYYYYTPGGENGNVLMPGVKTDSLFKAIRFSTELTNGIDGGLKEINVYAEAVQAQDAKPAWADVKLMDVEAIAAWFTTCGF